MPHQLLTISHRVARITLHNPPANVLTLSLLKELQLVLNEVEGDEEARGALPHWIQGRECRQVKDVPFVGNRALVFLNSVGAHGASRLPLPPRAMAMCPAAPAKT